MIQIEEISSLPPLEWGPHTQREMKLGDPFSTPSVLHRMYQLVGDEPIAVVGVIYTSATSVPWLWLAIAQTFYDRPQRNALRLLRVSWQLPSPLQTLIEDGFEEGRRFAHLFGFYPTGNFAPGYEIFRRG